MGCLPIQTSVSNERGAGQIEPPTVSIFSPASGWGQRKRTSNRAHTAVNYSLRVPSKLCCCPPRTSRSPPTLLCFGPSRKTWQIKVGCLLCTKHPFAFSVSITADREVIWRSGHDSLLKVSAHERVHHLAWRPALGHNVDWPTRTMQRARSSKAARKDPWRTTLTHQLRHWKQTPNTNQKPKPMTATTTTDERWSQGTSPRTVATSRHGLLFQQSARPSLSRAERLPAFLVYERWSMRDLGNATVVFHALVISGLKEQHRPPLHQVLGWLPMDDVRVQGRWPASAHLAQ